jgi:iron complex transport system permease protein
MRTATRAGGYAVALGALLAVVTLASAAVGPVAVPPATVAKTMLNALPGLAFSVPEPHRVIVSSIRLPRIALAAVVGLALASAGVVMQGFFRNPMADPSIIGVSSGAAVGAVGAIVAPAVVAAPVAAVVPVALPPELAVQTAAFVGALVTAFGVYLLATEGGHTPVATLLLAGVAVQTFLGAVISFLLLQSGESLRRVVYWLMGSLANATWAEVWVAALALPCVLVLGLFTRDLNVLLLGEEDAHGLGIEVERSKRLLLALAALTTAAAVAVAGVVGFVGLIVPHVMRLLVGPDHRVLLPTSALAGAVFLVGADTVARTAMAGAELPVGVVTAALGAPFFLYLLRSREVRSL